VGGEKINLWHVEPETGEITSNLVNAAGESDINVVNETVISSCYSFSPLSLICTYLLQRSFWTHPTYNNKCLFNINDNPLPRQSTAAVHRVRILNRLQLPIRGNNERGYCGHINEESSHPGIHQGK
jgi:hypothetical protein